MKGSNVSVPHSQRLGEQGFTPGDRAPEHMLSPTALPTLEDSGHWLPPLAPRAGQVQAHGGEILISCHTASLMSSGRRTQDS